MKPSAAIAAHPASGATLYDLLQVAPRATDPVIHAAYRVLARSYHPDHNDSESAETLMRELNAAYAVLSDARRRARYDAHLVRSGRLPAAHGRALAQSAAHPVYAPRSMSDLPAGSTRMAPRVRGIIAVAVILATIALLSVLLWLAYDAGDGAFSSGSLGLALGATGSTNSQLLVNSGTFSSTHNVVRTLGVA